MRQALDMDEKTVCAVCSLKCFCMSSRYQDMRRQIGFEIRDMWYNLGKCLAAETEWSLREGCKCHLRSALAIMTWWCFESEGHVHNAM